MLESQNRFAQAIVNRENIMLDRHLFACLSLSRYLFLFHFHHKHNRFTLVAMWWKCINMQKPSTVKLKLMGNFSLDIEWWFFSFPFEIAAVTFFHRFILNLIKYSFAMMWNKLQNELNLYWFNFAGAAAVIVVAFCACDLFFIAQSENFNWINLNVIDFFYWKERKILAY